MQSSDAQASPAPRKLGTAKSFRVGIVVAALALITAILLIWKPWDRCNAPEDICAFVQETEKLDGVKSSKVSYEVTSEDPKDGNSTQLSWEIVLDDTLAPVQASELGPQISKELAAVGLAYPKMSSQLIFVSGAPQKSQIRGLKIYPLSVHDSDQLQTELFQAFKLRELGASTAGNLWATASTPETLLGLAQYSAEHHGWVQLRLDDDSVNYSPLREVLVAEVELAIQLAARPSVQHVSFDNSQLSVSLDAPSGSAVESETLRWLDQHTPLAEPTAYTVAPSGFINLSEGWVGGKKPAHLIPQPVRLPEEVSAWPENADVPNCASQDLELSLSEPEPALGSRYMALYAKNAAQKPCTLKSYPQIEFLNEAGMLQNDVVLNPNPGISLEPIVVPAGESAISTLKWGAMSTSQDPDQTSALRVSAGPGLAPVQLAPQTNGAETTLDILDGAVLEQSPWVQALDGWAAPNPTQPERPAKERP